MSSHVARAQAACFDRRQIVDDPAVDQPTRQWSRPAILRVMTPLTLLVVFCTASFGQSDARVVRANWQLADRFSNEALRPALFSLTLTPRWIGETDSLWYSWRERKGTRFMLVVPKTRTKRPLFDHAKFASDLSALHRKP